jgi:hypothetical protein
MSYVGADQRQAGKDAGDAVELVGRHPHGVRDAALRSRGTSQVAGVKQNGHTQFLGRLIQREVYLVIVRIGRIDELEPDESLVGVAADVVGGVHLVAVEFRPGESQQQVGIPLGRRREVRVARTLAGEARRQALADDLLDVPLLPNAHPRG